MHAVALFFLTQYVSDMYYFQFYIRLSEVLLKFSLPPDFFFFALLPQRNRGSNPILMLV